MLEKHMDMYIKCCQKTMESMFNFHVNSNQIDYSIEIKEQYSPLNDTCVHIPFFGSISGEFFLSVDLNEWRYIVKNAIGLDDEEMVFSSLKESLNIIAGETISSISKEFPNLTYLSPRITIGKMYYPSVKTICAKVQMETLTTLDLGISVDLMQVELNEKLERSNIWENKYPQKIWNINISNNKTLDKAALSKETKAVQSAPKMCGEKLIYARLDGTVGAVDYRTGKRFWHKKYGNRNALSIRGFFCEYDKELKTFVIIFIVITSSNADTGNKWGFYTGMFDFSDDGKK